MLLVIPNVLTKAEVAEFRQKMDSADWVDGKVTAGSQSRLAKVNQQLPESSDLARTLGQYILQKLGQNELFLTAALPDQTYPPLFNRYGEGMSFGSHIDNAMRPIKGTGTLIRTDISSTLFLSEPEDYDGGVLTIETQYGAQEVKLRAGDMILYPGTSVHHVTEVTRGVRVAAFFWTQSLVRDAHLRGLLFDLDQSIQAISASLGGDHAEVIRLTGLYHNLLRQWSV